MSIAAIQDFTFYQLVDSRDGLPFYVGYTANPERRFQQHLTSDVSNRAKSERIAELHRLGLQPIMQELERKRCTEEEALQREAYWIRRRLDEGIALTNVLSIRTGAEVKATYYITPEDDMKLERIRLARRGKGHKIDKSALIREAIDLLKDE